MHQQNDALFGFLKNYGTKDRGVRVTLSYALIRLLSDQMYQSPLKAIEELVVNAYDAYARVCRVFVPTKAEDDFIAVFDDGTGMDFQGLTDLWQIGHSNKREEEIELRSRRKQIGKFGIGKLATYTIANKLTYISKKSGSTLAVTIDFRDFDRIDQEMEAQVPLTRTEDDDEVWHEPDVPSKRVPLVGIARAAEMESVQLDVYEVDDISMLTQGIDHYLRGLGVSCAEMQNTESWTLAILESLKPKGREIERGRLEWVLRTAMPRTTDFHLYLNGQPVSSSKLDYEIVTEFSITELPEKRIETLSDRTGEKWYVSGDQLKTDNLFDEGVSGRIAVTRKTLTGKSDDLGRSHGFFIRVRDRLINEEDPLFGLKPKVYDTFNRLDAQIRADNLDQVLTASRDSIETTRITQVFRELLLQVFQEADSRFKREIAENERGKKEGEKQLVQPRLVEYPIADALLKDSFDRFGSEADESWFYIDVAAGTNLGLLIERLYNEPRSKYRYQYIEEKPTDRVVRFDPVDSTFWLNEAHDFVREYREDPRTRLLLHDFVTAEMLLEAYMRESHVPPHVIGIILEKRDELLRSLAKDRSYSFHAIADYLRGSADNEPELEINLVVAMRALGFTARQISGAGEPDGLARYVSYPGGEIKLTLEAKSSKDVPSLTAIDFAGLQSHMERHSAVGCLLIAPAYPGSAREDYSEAARRAKQAKISCWTVEQLARFVESAEARHLNASHIVRIVLNHFAPGEVESVVESYLAEPSWDNHLLYRGILTAIDSLEGRLTDRPRTIDLISARVDEQIGLIGVKGSEIERAIHNLASASLGGMTVDGQNILLHVSVDELSRRVSSFVGSDSTAPRRISSFRAT